MYKLGKRNAARTKKGFTLIELLVTVTIMATLIVIIVIFINPAETFKRTRDTRRMADMSALQNAIFSYMIHSSMTDLDGAYTISCSDETTPAIYVSVPKAQIMPAAPLSWTYKQVESTTSGRLDGNGWLPINFTAANLGETFGRLPLDPVNKAESGNKYFYSYACKRNGNGFELNAKLEAVNQNEETSTNISASDGGDASDVYELGKTIGILPTTGVY